MKAKKNKKEQAPAKTESLKINPLTMGIFLLSFVLSLFVFKTIFSFQKNTIPRPSDELIINYLKAENYLYLDPYELKNKIDKNDKNFTLVDIREKNNYDKGHIVGAVNISSDDRQLFDKFRKLDNKKEIIIYGDNNHLESTRQTALLLWEKKIRAKILSIGWNEWRHMPNFWLKETDWGKFDVLKYCEPLQ